MITFPKLGRNGQFGNQLFQIASTIGIARKNGLDFAFPKWKNYDDSRRFFKEEIQKYFLNPLPRTPLNFKVKEVLEVPWGYHELIIEDNTGINGYFQSHRYFEDCEDEVRHYFAMKTLSPHKPEKNTVAIHVRRGDYDGEYHLLLDREYYRRAMEYFPSSYKFLVFSDNPALTGGILGRDLTVVNGNHFMTDFYLMSKCDHFITANSTFSWWAAYLGMHPEKQVIAPREWFGPRAQLSSPDSPKEWKVI